MSAVFSICGKSETIFYCKARIGGRSGIWFIHHDGVLKAQCFFIAPFIVNTVFSLYEGFLESMPFSCNPSKGDIVVMTTAGGGFV